MACLTEFGKEERCRFRIGFGDGIRSEDAQGHGRWLQHLTHGVTTYDVMPFLGNFEKRWGSKMYDQDTCTPGFGGFALRAADHRWQIQHKYSELGGSECDIYEASTHDTFAGHMDFMRFRRRWNTRHRYKNSSEWINTGIDAGRYALSNTRAHAPNVWDDGEFGCPCCGVGGTSGDPLTPNTSPKPPPPKLYARVVGSLFDGGDLNFCTANTGYQNIFLDVEIELIRLNVGWAIHHPIVSQSLVAYYLCSISSDGGDDWGIDFSKNIGEGSGRYFKRSMTVDDGIFDASSNPYVNSCFATDSCAPADGCIVLSFWLMCVDPVFTTHPAFEPVHPCPGNYGKIFVAGNAFGWSHPNQKSATLASTQFVSHCFDDCSDIDVTFTAPRESIVTGTDPDEIGAGAGWGESWTLHLQDKPHFDWPTPDQFATAEEGYWHPNGWVRNSDFQDGRFGPYWRDLTKTPNTMNP